MRNSIDDKIKLRNSSCSRYVNNIIISEDGLIVIFLSKNVYIYYATYGEGYFYLVKSIDFEWNLTDMSIENRIKDNFDSGRKRKIKEFLKNENLSYESNSIIRSCAWTLSGLFNSSLSLLAILTCNGCCIIIDPNIGPDNSEYESIDINIKCHNVSIVFDLTKIFNAYFNDNNKNDDEEIDDKITSIIFFPFFEKETSGQNNKNLLTVIGSNGRVSLLNIKKNDNFPTLICDIITSYEFSSIEDDDNITNLFIIEKRLLNSYASILCGTSKGNLFMLNVVSDDNNNDNNKYQLKLLWKYETHSSIYDMSLGNNDEIFIAGDAGKIIVTDVMNKFTAIIDDFHTNIISSIKVFGCYDNMNNQRILPSSLVTSSFDGMIKTWNYSNTSKYIGNIISSSTSSMINGNIVDKEMEYTVNNVVQGVSCDPWGLIFAYSEIEPALISSSRKVTFTKQNHGGSAISMITNHHFANDWCIDKNEWIKLFHIMLSNNNASRLSLLSVSIALSKNLLIYYQAANEACKKKEELIDEHSSSDSDESNDNDGGNADENKVDRMKLIVETVVTNKLGKLRFIISIIIQAIIKIGRDYNLSDNHINIQKMSEEEILWVELLSLPSKASHDIIRKKMLLWKTLNHIVQGIIHHHHIIIIIISIIIIITIIIIIHLSWRKASWF